MPYAARTRVPISRTRTDIEELLAKHGATGFAYANEANRTMMTGVQHVRTAGTDHAVDAVDRRLRPHAARRQADNACTAARCGKLSAPLML